MSRTMVLALLSTTVLAVSAAAVTIPAPTPSVVEPPAPPTASVAPDSSAAEAPLATLDGTPIFLHDLNSSINGRLYQLRLQQYRVLADGVRDYVFGQLQQREAEREKITRDELYKRNVTDKVAEPSKEEVDALLKQYRAQLPTDEAQARESVTRFLRSQKKNEREQAFRAELLAKANLTMLVEPPRVNVSVSATDPTLGPANAPVTIVEFADFQCPFCQKVQATLARLRSEYGDKIRLVARQGPLPAHPQARPAAEAALCARDQGKFWPLHDWLFSNQDKLSPEAIKAEAAALGLDATKFATCVDTHAHAGEVEADLDAAARMGVTAMPAFFINGRLLQGAEPYAEFKRVIDDELARVARAKGTAPAGVAGTAP